MTAGCYVGNRNTHIDYSLWFVEPIPSTISGVSEISLPLGQTIRKYRLEAGLSQETLAEHSDLHWTYVSQLERGKRNVSVDALRRIARSLGVSAPQLLMEAEEFVGNQ